MKLSFLGSTKIITGANYLIEAGDKKLLIDCGLFQGSKPVTRKNYQPFYFNPKEIDLVILTHAHIDHSGRIPKLIKEGFTGNIYCTKATADLCSIMLPDSGHIQEIENEWDNRKRTRSGEKPRNPLYTMKEAEESLRFFKPVLYGQKIELNPNISLRFKDAGHILGSSIIELWIKEDGKEVKLVFSGDLGRKDRPILRDPFLVEEADYVIVESTYGNRVHGPSENDAQKLISIINNTVKSGGNVVIPSFAVERAQDIVYELNKYYSEHIKTKDKDFLNVPVYIDSPLTVSATEIFLRNPDCFDEETMEFINNGENPLDFHNLKFTGSVEESKELNFSKETKVIISASGMCNEGRIKHHLKHNLWRKESSIVFVGYQAKGTLGRRIKDGEKAVRIFGEEIKINAAVHSLEGFSGHADKEGILWWLKGFKNSPKKIFVVHGEEEAAEEISQKIEEELKIKAHIPELGESLTIEGERILIGENIDIGRRDRETIEFEEGIEKLKLNFLPLLHRLENKVSNSTDIRKLVKIKNKIIELKKDMSDLNMMLTEEKKKDKN